MVFWDAESSSVLKNISLLSKGLKSKMGANFGSKTVHDSISTDI